MGLKHTNDNVDGSLVVKEVNGRESIGISFFNILILVLAFLLLLMGQEVV